MEYEETRRLGMLGYDEKTETWYVQSRDSQRLALTQQSLSQLVQLYNSIHKGAGLVLVDQRELRRLQESHRRNSETLRDLYLCLDRRERMRPWSRLRRWLRSLLQKQAPNRPEH